MDNLHRGSANCRYYFSVKILSLKSDSYAAAEDWDDLVHAFTESLKNSPLDEIIHTAIPDLHEQRPEYIRSVSYDRLDEVPKLLLSTTLNALGTGATLVHQHRPYSDAATGTQSGGNCDRQGQQKPIEDIPQERVVYGKEAEVTASGEDYEGETDGTRFNAVRAMENAYSHRLERNRADAARRIQAAYRRHLKRKSVVRQGIDATQAHYWYLLRKRSTEIEWPEDSRYYLLFRVPLAYILVCLDTAKTFIESEKEETKRRVMTEDDRDLEHSLIDTLHQRRCDGADSTLYQWSN